MKKGMLALCLSLGCVMWGSGQDVQSRSPGSAKLETSATAKTDSIKLENGTRLSADLQKTLDVRKAKVGDEVVLKTTHEIKSNGRVVVDKGARLFGRVTHVAKKGSDGASRIVIRFDRLEHGALVLPISASISSVTTTATSASLQDDNSLAGGAATSSRSTSSTSSGLLGPGGVISSTTAVLGSTANATTNAVGSTTRGLGNSLGTIEISQSSNASVQGESVLSLQGGNLRLEKGTRFNLLVTQSANASTTRDQ